MPLNRLKLEKSQSLVDIDANKTPGFKGDEAAALERCNQLRFRLIQLQERLYAEQKQSLLVVFQAMDTAGKDSVIRRVFSGLNPQGVGVIAFKRPSEEELQHDFLWRVHAHTPAAGQITLFNRSHYEDVLVVRVHKLVSKSVWKQRYSLIRQFEDQLAHRGTQVIKIFLHIDLEEQRQRLQDRLDDPEKNWKFQVGDLAERKLWPHYMEAYRDAIVKTHSKTAPWYVIPANKKWYRDMQVLQILVDTLEKMNPQFPRVTFDPASIQIE
jgi:PPK2 family polyphosphate:nucleotide phosphotransferase